MGVWFSHWDLCKQTQSADKFGIYSFIKRMFYPSFQAEHESEWMLFETREQFSLFFFKLELSTATVGRL